MKIHVSLISIMLVLTAVFAGCSSIEDPENNNLESASLSFVYDAIAKASEHNFEKENLPGWLTEFIYNLEPNNERNVAAFQTTSKGEVIYYVYDEYFSCQMCATFKSNGEKVDWSSKDSDDFFKSTKHWELIYLNKRNL